MVGLIETNTPGSDEIKLFSQALENLKIPNCDQKQVLNELNNLIRCSQPLRENGLSNEFYSNLKLILSSCLTRPKTEEFWTDFEVLIRCVKNSGAAFKAEVNQNELDICTMLIDFIGGFISGDMLTGTQSNDTMISKCFLFILQYFFNLSQGNQNMLNHFIKEWVSLSLRLLTASNVSYDIYNLSSMILVNSCIDKHNEDLLTVHFQSMTSHNFIKMIGKVFSNLDYVKHGDRTDFVDHDQMELEFLVDESNSNWSYRLVDYLLETDSFINEILSCFGTYDLIDRINIAKMLKVKLYKSQKSSDETYKSTFLNVKFVEVLLKLYEAAGQFFLDYLVKLTQSPEFESQKIDYSVLVHMHLTELKTLAYCLSDLLTIEHTNHVKTQLHLIQDNQEILQKTCAIFQQLYENETLKDLFEIIKQKDLYIATHSSLKCEMIRLIGILIFENKANQALVAENKCMDLIANCNLGMDVCNPFIREWSLVALKHILAHNDLK